MCEKQKCNAEKMQFPQTKQEQEKKSFTAYPQVLRDFWNAIL
jgi:hypothetical protein